MSQVNVNTIANASGTNSLPIHKLLGPTAHFRSVIFPSNSSGTFSWDGASGTLDFPVNVGNQITFTSAYDNSGSGILNYSTVITLSGFEVGGIYQIDAHMSHTRTSNASISDIRLNFKEGSSIIATGVSSTPTHKLTNLAFTLIRDYTTAVPSSIQLQYASNTSNYPVTAGSGFTIRRIA
jgi:hypothetical protein